MTFLKLLISFAPWLSFLVIAHGSPFRVKLGLAVALILSIVMGAARFHRGIILWVGLIFFSCATVAVAFFESVWTLRHMGVLANGALAIGTWLTIFLGRPFTLDYAKEHTDPSLWNSPLFLKSNYVITSAWAATFSINCWIAYFKMERLGGAGLAYEFVSYSLLIATALFTVCYPKHLQKLTQN